METKLTVTVEELESIMDPIVGLFPRHFLWKLNQTDPVRASKPSPPGTFTAAPQLDIFRLLACYVSPTVMSFESSRFVYIFHNTKQKKNFTKKLQNYLIVPQNKVKSHS